MASTQDRLSRSLPNLSRIQSEVSNLSKSRFASISLTDLQKYKDDYLKLEFRPSPFSSRWIYGYNQNIPPINLSTNFHAIIFYAASNCGVVYDWRTNDMKLLEGHNNMVTCIATDASGRWLVTADSGPENIITIWDSNGLIPRRTIFNPHGTHNLANLAISPDAKYLLTLAYEDKPTLNWWIWSFGKDVPHASMTLLGVPSGAILTIIFNPTNTEQFFLLTKRDVWIGECTKLEVGDYQKEIKYDLRVRKPLMKGCAEVGRLTCLAHAGRSRQLLVGCTRGALLVFGYSINFTESADAANINNLRFVKLLRLEKSSISAISTVDDVIITGNDHGEIKFYDLQLRLLYWFQGFQVKGIKNMSYNISPRSYKMIDSSRFPKGCQACPCTEHNLKRQQVKENIVQQLVMSKVPTDATKQMHPFIIRDFIICTEHEGIGLVDLIKGSYTSIVEHRSFDVSAIAIHHNKALLCVAYEDGLIELIKFIRRKSIIKRDLREHFRVTQPPKLDSIHSDQEDYVSTICATCLKYSPSGLHLACGLDNGDLLFLDPTTIEIKSKMPLKATADAVRQICYSQDSSTLALSDSERKVCVYRYNCGTQEWLFIGKHRAHYKPITAILFSEVKNDDGFYKLFSFGEDRIMVEYNVGESSEEQLEILSLDRVEQSAVPLAVLEWPAPSLTRSEIPTVLMANDQHKYKLMNYNTTMTLKTYLGPRYETPVCKMILTNTDGNNPDYLIFSTKTLIGIQKLPLDGNPYKHVAMLGHPNELTNMCYSEEHQNLFTTGERDSCVHQWVVKFRTVDTTTKLGGNELYPYYCLLEGGRQGHLFQEMRDLFYYVQILCQGTFSPAVHRVGDYVPIYSLPDLMRALGFFPSQFEVENLVEEAKYNVYNEKPLTEIGFEDFVRLYLNHRPAFGENYDKLSDSFHNFASHENDKGEPFVTNTDLIDILTNCGERFSPELTTYLLNVLLGLNNEEDAVQEEEHMLILPEEITYKNFVSDILGLEETNSTPEKREDKESVSPKSSVS